MSQPQTRPQQTADHRRRLSLALAVAAIGLAVLPSAAAAQDFGSDEPALDEYIESLPIAEGNRPAGHEGRPSPLPPSTQRALEATPHGRALERLATSPAAGAPSRAPRKDGQEESERSEPAKSRVRPAEIEETSLASAMFDTAGGGGATLLVLALLASVAGAILFTRTRSRRP